MMKLNGECFPDLEDLRACHLSLIAVRIQANVPSRTTIPSLLVKRSYGTLITVSRDHQLISMTYKPEPILVAAASSKMSSGGVVEAALKEFTDVIRTYGPETGAGGEVLAMLMAVAATDRMTGYRPFVAVNCQVWLETWLGLKEGSLSSPPKPEKGSFTLPASVSNGWISIGQFVYGDLSDLDRSMVEQGRIFGVGIIPFSRKNQGFDLLLPFECQGGVCGAFLVEVKNRAELYGKQFANAKKGVWIRCESLASTMPEGSVVLPIIISLGTGKVYFSEAPGAWTEHSLELNAANTWGKPHSFLELRSLLSASSPSFDIGEWAYLSKNFKLPAEMVKFMVKELCGLKNFDLDA